MLILVNSFYFVLDPVVLKDEILNILIAGRDTVNKRF